MRLFNYLNKMLRFLDVQVNKASSLKQEKLEHIATLNRVALMYMEQLSVYELNKGISGIVFSKDRAMQLQALLSSYFFYTKNYAALTILYTCSTEEHRKSYAILKDEMKAYPVNFIQEDLFALQLRYLVKNTASDRIFFMTDDGLFVDHYDLHDSLQFDPVKNIFSLRLGVDMDFCYSYNRPQQIPAFKEFPQSDNDFKTWKWSAMKDSPDWIYPLSVDATIFLKSEVAIMLEALEFKNPNSLEYQMQQYNDLFICRNGICYDKVKYVNVPCNIVQTEFDNISTGAFSTAELLKLFLDGKRIDWRLAEKRPSREVQTMKYSFI